MANLDAMKRTPLSILHWLLAILIVTAPSTQRSSQLIELSNHFVALIAEKFNLRQGTDKRIRFLNIL